jgi:hypothetical protein
MLYRVFLSICLLLGFATANLNQQTTVLKNVKADSATIDIGNLSIGQTGVIIHNFDESKSIIIADFEVVTTSLNQSTLKFTYIDYDNKVAIPYPKISVKNGDTVILNHMYNTSFIVAPDFESFELVNKNFSSQNFLHSDIFGAYLKTINQPIPSQKDFKDFCKINNIGTIFFIIEGFVYVVDSKSFAILEEYKVKKELSSSTHMTPFYTNIEDIKLGLFSFGENSIASYNNYYSKLLGL